ncbi:ArnT family glycosyltransferase [Zoogloea sp.]|uniref:ArnT family glycosyltransferase n=1 Tax=Zoogloea sp. TaxID=49181 RepID=UPI0035B376C5
MNARSYVGPLALIAAVLTVYRIWVIGHLGIDLYVDEAYYWGWSQNLDWGYFSKPPVIATLIAGSTALFGNGLIAIKLPSLLIYPATAFALYALGCRMYSPKVGFWAGLSFMSMPLVAALGLFVSTDAPLLLCWTLALLLLLRALDNGHWGAWLACGAVIGVGLMSKYTMAAFLPSALLLIALNPKQRHWLLRPQPWLAVLLAVAILSPNLYWNWTHDFPTFRHTAEITRVGGHGERGWHPGQLGEFIGAQWLSFGPLLGVLLGIALFRGGRLWRDASHRTLLVFIVPLLLLVSLQALTGRANGNWAAPIFVGACLLVPAVFLQSGRRWLIAGVAVNLVASTLAYHWPDIAHATGTALTAKNDPYKRARGWIHLADGVAPQLETHPGSILVGEDRELIAHLVYRLHPAEYAAWNPDHLPIDHYELTTTLKGKEGRDVLYVSRKPEIPAIAAHFGGSELLCKVVVPVHKDFRREVYVFLLKDFKGY